MTTKKNINTSSFLFNFYIFLGAFQAAIIIFWILALYVWLPQQQDSTAVGANLILGLLFPLFLVFTCLVAITALIGLSIYLVRHKPKGKKRILSVITLAISLIPVGLGIFMTYHLTVVYPAESQRLEQEREESERKAIEQELKDAQLVEEIRQLREGN